MKDISIRNFIKDELTGWKLWEIAWLAVACAVITALSIYWHDDLMGIVSATTGVACVVCTGKGKLSAYVFGTVNVVLYAIIAYKQKYYGEVMLNALYYLPLQFYGFAVWKKHMNADTHEVEKKKMSAKWRAVTAGAVITGTAAYGLVLRALGGSLPFVDALSTVVSVVAMYISVKMYAEQWLLWIAVDIVTVVMWAVVFAQGGESIATLLMWIVYLANAVIMYFKWRREAERNAV